MSKNKYYITTAIPYVNAKPHIGHALEYVIADAIHRYYELTGYEVHIISGADENALKNVQAAQKAEIPIKEFLDQNSQVFEDFYRLLEVELDEFRRGSDQKLHWTGVEEIWKKVSANGDLYKKKYKGLYCVGCEEFKTEKDLVSGRCPEHDKEPETVEEENYFFKLSKYQDRLLKIIEGNEYEILPDKRKNEIISFIKSGLEDFSVSRSKDRAKGVGVPVPGDPGQKIYVWFDALTIYMTAVGFGYDEKLWNKWWPADLHIIGKDIIRFHAVYWPAMLMSAGLPLPKKLLVHGFVTSWGRKMSKSIGNVIDPYDVIDKHGVEALRYYLLSQIPTQDDGDFTYERFENVYQSDLANGLGNLVSRVAAMIEKSNTKLGLNKVTGFSKQVENYIKSNDFDKALAEIGNAVRTSDMYINQNGVWALEGEEKVKALIHLAGNIRQIAYDLQPFLPGTAEKIQKQYGQELVKSGDPLFPRLR